MVLQYKKKEEGAKWKEYPGKGNISGQPDDYDFRLLSHDKSKVLAEKGTYDKVLKRMRQIEFFKHKKGQGRITSIVDEIIDEFSE